MLCYDDVQCRASSVVLDENQNTELCWISFVLEIVEVGFF